MSMPPTAPSLESGASPGIKQDDDDSMILKKLGLRHELRREFTKFTTISFSVGFFGCAQGIAATANTPLLLGGPATLIWAWVLGGVGCMAMAASVAELVSAYPTAGGIYTSTAFVYPSRYRSSVTFITGWLTLVGMLAGPGSGMFGASQMVYGIVTLATSGSFVPSTGQTLGLIVGLNIIIGVMSTFPTLFQHRLSNIYLYLTVIAALAVIIGIPVGGRGHLAPSEFVWTSIVDKSGWNNRGFAFLLGLFSIQWIMTGYDASAHLSEEIKHPGLVTPFAITLSVAVTIFLGFFVNVSLSYGIRDLDSLPGPTGLVFSQILLDNLGRRGAMVVMIIIVTAFLLGAAIGQLVAVRAVYALSRDGILPDRKFFSRVSKLTQTPINAALLVAAVSIILNLLLLASVVAVNAVFSMVAVALDLSYAIAIFGKVLIQSQGNPDVQFQPGPFYMGKAGYYVNIYSIVWTIFETGVLIMPQVFPVTPANMNYTGPIVGGVVGLSWLWYILYWVMILDLLSTDLKVA